jgi:aspartyl-tRNA(Asn)/glutamyl-tRNA(Gln) amidotransferase subunit A
VREAGAVIVGKTLTHEFAWGITSNNPHFGPARNPYDPERVPGGSSGGSGVALAYGGCALALGSDTGGSIRIPAAFCGVSGLKPTYGRVPTAGVFPLAPSLDHAGPMARTPGDVRLLYEVLADTSADHDDTPLRIARCPDLHLVPLEPAIQRAFDNAAAALGADAEVRFLHAERIYPAFATLQMAEAHAAHTRAGLYPGQADAYGADVSRRLDNAARVTLDEYLDAALEREAIRARFTQAFEHADLLLTPIAAVTPEPISAGAQSFRDAVLPFTVPQDIAGLPAAAVPVGFDDLGLPIGVQLTGPAGAEARVLAAAEKLYAATASAREGSASFR